MKFNISTVSLLILTSISCANAAQNHNYTLTVNMSEDEDGMLVYVTDYDNGLKIDSAVVENGVAKIEGNINDPFYARILLDGKRIGDIFIEKNDITFNPEKRSVNSSGNLNKAFNDLQSDLSKIASEYRSLGTDSMSELKKKQIVNDYNSKIENTISKNVDNALGYVLFLQKAQELDLAELDDALKSYPQFASKERITRLRQHLMVKDETSVGKKYKDFSIESADGVKKLSDYVSKDHYTLVDFWASWCGPCIRETKVLKQLYEKYNGKGLDIVGVAVWDQPNNTIDAINKHQLPWPQIINAQTIPTDLYGISGIPCIILIAPDGTIVSRDKQDEELVADVENALNSLNSNKND